jgi:hypothetical protein
MDKTNIVCFGQEIAGTKVANPKNVLDSSPGEDVFCTLESNDVRKACIRLSLFVSARILQEQMLQTEKCPGSESR